MDHNLLLNMAYIIRQNNFHLFLESYIIIMASPNYFGQKTGSELEESSGSNQTSSEFVNRYYELEPYTLSMLVIGSSGTGKSMFCNFLVQTKEYFAGSCGMLSVTDRVEHCVKKIEDEKVLIVDSPGFNDPIKSDNEIFEKISETAILTRDGVDVIAIMVNPTSRFSPHDVNTLKIIESLGGNMWEHAFLIFNNASRIEEKFKKKSEEYIEQILYNDKCPKELKEMLKEVGHRYICVESVDRWGDDDYWQYKSNEVLEIILRLKYQNKGMRYKNKMMRMGIESYKIIKRLEKENIEKRIEIERLKFDVGLSTRIGEDQSKYIQDLEKALSNVEIGYKKNEHILKNEMKLVHSNMLKCIQQAQDTNKKLLESLQKLSAESSRRWRCSMM